MSGKTVFTFILMLILMTALSLSQLPAQSADNSTADWYKKNIELTTELQQSNKGLNSSIINVVSEIPRHLFADSVYYDIAYENISLLGYGGGIIPSPSDIVLAITAVSTSSSSNVLVAGNNAGYAAAILAKISNHVYLIEETDAAEEYPKLFKKLGYNNITVAAAADINSFSNILAFDRIFIHGAVEGISEKITEKLSIQGSLTGIMAQSGGFQQIITISRSLLGDSISCFGSCFFPEIVSLKISN